MTCPRPHSQWVGESRIESGASDFQPSASAKGCLYQANFKKQNKTKQTPDILLKKIRKKVSVRSEFHIK